MLKSHVREEKKVSKYYYHLTGWVGYWHSDCHNPEEYLDEKFGALNDEEAVKIARKKVEDFLEKNKKRSPVHNPEIDFCDSRALGMYFKLEKFIWGMEYKDKEEELKTVKPARVVETTTVSQ